MISLGFAAVGFGISSILCGRRRALFVLTLLWGWYLALLVFFSSPLWLWELAEDYPVRPVAAMIARTVPADKPVYTSHPYSRPSLDFYSNHRIQPLTSEDLSWRARQDPHSYYLVQGATADLLLNQGLDLVETLETLETLETTESWVLLTKR
jgi:4-amino-4-deoxy-L-arabinose transferase-like glycosyltransferase